MRKFFHPLTTIDRVILGMICLFRYVSRKKIEVKEWEFAEQALSIDPKFASAYNLLASAYGNLGYHTENSRKAFELSDRQNCRLTNERDLLS